VEHRLVQAGLPLRGSEFAVICLGTTLAGEIVFFLLSGGKIMIGMAGGLVGYLVPIYFLRFKIARRAKAFNNQLGDTLTLVANSLRTGYSFMQAVEMVSREMAPPISVEFARILKEMNLGIPTEEALNNMAKRVDSDDLDLVITAVLIQRQVGGNLAEVLDNIANTIRTRIRLKGELKALTAQGRFSGIIVGLLPLIIGTALYALNPEYMRLLFTHPMGKMMLMGAAGSMVLGLLLIRKIVNITL
jgi:tight adherence protein B